MVKPSTIMHLVHGEAVELVWVYSTSSIYIAMISNDCVCVCGGGGVTSGNMMHWPNID